MKPTKDEINFCSNAGLKAYQEWVNLHDSEVFLIGPFDFAHIHGRKSKDHIHFTTWETFHDIDCKVDNAILCHVDTPFHSKHGSKLISASVNSAETVC